jgi:DNA polymerase-3 subunit gamma/tau
MLSTAAFNGLLKTLEEPPPYVKFIFATTEIRKVPVTILSRCMRFDLRRVPPQTMTAHLIDLLSQEGIAYEPEALAMSVRAGEGSVRDNQSLLDPAISHGDGKVTAATVKAMLGLGDRARSIDLFEALMAGNIAGALTLLHELYDAGADPETVMGDLADFTNLVTRIKVVPAAADDVSLTPDERSRGAALASRLGMRALSRTWQILFKGHEEVQKAGNALQAAEMVLVRLAYAADLPTPDELIAKLSNAPAPSALSGGPIPRGTGGGGPSALRALPEVAPRFEPAPAPTAVAPPAPRAFANPRSYADLVALAGEKRDILVKHALESSLRPVSIGDARLEVALVQGADPGIIQDLMAKLKLWTGRQWVISLANDAAHVPTLREQREEQLEAVREEAHHDPLVQAILDTFPGATVRVTVKQEQIPIEAYADAIRDSDEDDDP